MKKVIIGLLGVPLLLGSCGTYTGSGAATGGMFGSILGSAIGGLAGGRHGSDIGTIVGMAGGAAIGAAAGASADQERAQSRTRDREELHEHYEKVMRNKDTRSNSAVDRTVTAGDELYIDKGDSGFDATNSGDDRLYDFDGIDYTTNYSASEPIVVVPNQSEVAGLNTKYAYTSALSVKNARFVDTNQDNVISSGEISKIIFEVYNNGDVPVYDIVPVVEETTGNKHIQISPSIHVERLAPGKGIRYTAMVQTDKRLKNGTAEFSIYVLQDAKKISNIIKFSVNTLKKK